MQGDIWDDSIIHTNFAIHRGACGGEYANYRLIPPGSPQGGILIALSSSSFKSLRATPGFCHGWISTFWAEFCSQENQYMSFALKYGYSVRADRIPPGSGLPSQCKLKYCNRTNQTFMGSVKFTRLLESAEVPLTEWLKSIYPLLPKWFDHPQ